MWFSCILRPPLHKPIRMSMPPPDFDVVESAVTLSHHNEQIALDAPIITGITVYVVTLIALMVYDKMSTSPSLSENDEVPWIVPLTADQTVPLPTNEELLGGGRRRVGSRRLGRSNIDQFISVSEPSNSETFKVSDEWSLMYGTKVYIIKQRA